MNLSELKLALPSVQWVRFKFPAGEMVPAHFHLSEIAKVEKHLMDCGGVLRKNTSICLQLYVANDFEHRLSGLKLLDIVQRAEKELLLHAQEEVEVELQGRSMERYEIEFDRDSFLLKALYTDCLAREKCGIDLSPTSLSCSPNSCCC